MKSLIAKPAAIAMIMSLAFAASLAHASNAIGQITWLRASTGQSNARISVMLNGPPPQPNPWYTSPCFQTQTAPWFSYENADIGLGKIWTDILVGAYQSGKQVVIHGSGSCDLWGYETIGFIDSSAIM
jgi:hypothetical protein